MLLMRPEAAHRVTVFGSTRKRAATSPGVRSRSLFPSTLSPPDLRLRSLFSVSRTDTRFLPRFPEISRRHSLALTVTRMADGP